MCCACTQCYNCPKCTTALFHGISLDGCQCQCLQHWSFGSAIAAWCWAVVLYRLLLHEHASILLHIQNALHLVSRLLVFLYCFSIPSLFFRCFFFFCVHNLIFKTASFSISQFSKLNSSWSLNILQCVCFVFFLALCFSSHLSLAETYVREKCCWTILCASPNSIVLPLVCFQESCEKMMLMPFYFLFILLDFFWLVQH